MNLDFVVEQKTNESLVSESHNLEREMNDWAKENGVVILNLKVNAHISDGGKIRIKGLFANLDEATLFMMRFG